MSADRPAHRVARAETDDEVLARKRREFLEAAGPPSSERISRLRQIFRESERRQAAERAADESA